MEESKEQKLQRLKDRQMAFTKKMNDAAELFGKKMRAKGQSQMLAGALMDLIHLGGRL